MLAYYQTNRSPPAPLQRAQARALWKQTSNTTGAGRHKDTRQKADKRSRKDEPATSKSCDSIPIRHAPIDCLHLELHPRRALLGPDRPQMLRRLNPLKVRAGTHESGEPPRAPEREPRLLTRSIAPSWTEEILGDECFALEE